MPSRAVWAKINLDNIRNNIREIKSCVAGGAKFCAVIKANAYGHGVIPVARIAEQEGADYFAVAILDEAIELRKAGFKQPILILGFTPPEQSEELVFYDIEQAVFTLDAAQAISAAAARQHKTARVHIKVDTGMSRIGVMPQEAGDFAKTVAELPNLKIEGLFSHFAKSDCADKSFAKVQLERFKEAASLIKAEGIEIPLKHIANSAAILEMPEAHFDMVRAGIILYGLWPSDEVERTINLKSAMELKARLAYVKTLPTGAGISYGQTFVTKRESEIATIPVGYADGWTRLLSGKAMADFKGKRVPIVGRICMDQCMADVTGLGAKAGDEITLFGSSTVSIDEIAALLGTINYEITCMVSRRVPRVY
jgi:alanine racemase